MKTKLFQTQDLARAALHDGLILAWDTGLGKTWAMFLWPLLKVGLERSPSPWGEGRGEGASSNNPTDYDYGVALEAHAEAKARGECATAAIKAAQPALTPSLSPAERGTERRPTIRPKAPVLILAPGDLHQQIAREAREHFHIEVIPLTSQQDFVNLTTDGGRPQRTEDGRPLLAPGFYITSYSQISTNGVERPPKVAERDVRELMDWLGMGHLVGRTCRSAPAGGAAATALPDYVGEVFAKREDIWAEHYGRLHFSPEQTLRDLDQRYAAECHHIENMRDEEMAAKARALATDSYRVLQQLCCHKPKPVYGWLNGEQQDFVLREFITRWLAEGMVNDGVVREYPIGPEPDDGRAVAAAPTPSEADQQVGPTDETDTRPTWKIRCVYSPSLSDLCYRAFETVVIDEGVKMKGTETFVGRAVRQLAPKYRLVLTATPVKNRLRDIFWLAGWAAGGKAEAHARFPYRDDAGECERFAKEFMVSECNITKARNAAGQNGGTFLDQVKTNMDGTYGTGHWPVAPTRSQPEIKGKSRYTKLTAEVCNIHRLWKLLGPVVLRRRKQDCGEDIVPKIRKVVRCEMGRQQKLVYQYHLDAAYVDKNGKDAIGARLQALRVTAADPSSALLIEKPGEPHTKCAACDGKGHRQNSQNSVNSVKKPQAETCPHCSGAGRIPLPHRSGTHYIPKTATVLQLIQEIMARGEQVVVGSAFNDPLDGLAGRLREAGVRHLLLDGRTSQNQRGNKADVFKRGRYQDGRAVAAAPPHSEADRQVRPTNDSIPVLLAGVECMAEGHSFHRANNVILLAYSWAYDKFIQFINRVHRMTSLNAVNVYVVIANGTIDRKLEALCQEKGDAAELVLDGQLMGERTEEINLAELLNIARREFNAEDETIDEARLEQDWPALRERLRAAQLEWDASAPVMEFTDAQASAPKTKKKVMMKNRFSPAQMAAFESGGRGGMPRAARHPVAARPEPPRIKILPEPEPLPANVLSVPGIPSEPATEVSELWRLRRRRNAERAPQRTDVWGSL